MSARPGPLARLFAPRALRWSLIELCRRTTHEGWERLLAAEAAGRGVALVIPAGGPWVVAARALAAWAGPLHLALPSGAAERRLARLVCSLDGEGSSLLAPDPETVRSVLATRGKVLFVIAGEAGPDLARPSIPAGVPVLPLAVERPSRGRYRVVVGGASD